MKVAFPVAPEAEAEQAEAARLLFAGPVEFLKGVVAMDGLPPQIARKYALPDAAMWANPA